MDDLCCHGTHTGRKAFPRCHRRGRSDMSALRLILFDLLLPPLIPHLFRLFASVPCSSASLASVASRVAGLCCRGRPIVAEGGWWAGRGAPPTCRSPRLHRTTSVGVPGKEDSPGPGALSA